MTDADNLVNSRLYKILVVGEVHTGKSAIIRRYVHNFYNDNYRLISLVVVWYILQSAVLDKINFFRSTVGVDFHVKIVPFNEDLQLRLQLWDIAGQERFSQMTRAYYKGRKLMNHDAWVYACITAITSNYVTILGAHGALIVFDQASASSYDAVTRSILAYVIIFQVRQMQN